MEQTKPRVYFNHTTRLFYVKMGMLPKATVAVRIAEDGQNINYGITICSEGDNFSRTEGRQRAAARLENNFGTVKVPASMKEASEKEKCLFALYNLTASVLLKSRKWKGRATAFNNKYPQLRNAKVEVKEKTMLSEAVSS